jgi:hypothetical protein
MAFLAREAQSPLHLQHCHVFRTSTPEQSEDLNTLIGNAFRAAYATQIQGEHLQQQQDRPGSSLGHHHLSTLGHFKGGGGIPQSRSADSLLSPDILHGTLSSHDDLGIADMIQEDEPVYETPDFVRSAHLRLSENTFQKVHRAGQTKTNTYKKLNTYLL